MATDLEWQIAMGVAQQNIERLTMEHDQLAARVERLEDALNHAVYCFDEDYTPDYAKLEAALKETPSQSLARIKAEAVEEAAKAAQAEEDPEAFMWAMPEMVDFMNEYAQRIRDEAGGE